MSGDASLPVDVQPVAQTGWLNRNVVGMALASFFSDAGHEMATAILPLFLISIGAPAAALGTIEGVADAVSSFVKLGAGWFSDRIGRRKPIAVAGYFLTGLTTGLFALVVNWPQVLLARAAGWFGRGIRGPVRDAMLAESVQPEARGRAFGFHRMGDTLGAIAGPALALAALSLVTGQAATEAAYRSIFLVTMIPGVLSALSFLVFVKERARQPNHHTNLIASVRSLPRNFRLYLIGVGLFGIGDFAHSLLTLRAAEMLTPTLGASAAGQTAILLYVIHNVLYAGMSFPIGVLADRIGKRGLLAAGYGLAAVMGMGWIVAVPSVAYLAVLFALGGTFIAAEDALEGALAADLLPEDVRGTGYGVLATVNGLGDFVSSVVVGLLWTAFVPAVGFAYGVILSVLGAIVIFRVR
jgi:MFS family permease